jgi:hypothetical protein
MVILFLGTYMMSIDLKMGYDSNQHCPVCKGVSQKLRVL